MTTQRLDPAGGRVRVGNLVLTTPGYQGVAEAHDLRSGGTRGEEIVGDLDEIFARHLEEQEVIQLKQVVAPPTPTAAPDDDSRSIGPQPKLEVPEPAPDEEQVVVIQDEDGSMSWHFAEPSQRGRAARGAGTRTFQIELHKPESGTQELTRTRGPLGFIGRKLIKVFGFKIAGVAGAKLLRHWEGDKRPHRVREFTRDNIQIYEVGELTSDRWSQLTTGPTLLFIHGTNSQIHSGYHALPPEQLAAMHERYGGRVVGFDHPTLSYGPNENAEFFLERVGSAGQMEVDIVCHSRGGLVGRELAYRSEGSGTLNVRKIIFVATPNAGTALADTKHIKTFLNTYTNLFKLIPPIGFVDVLETIINLAKEVALNVHEELQGLQSMNPTGDYLKALNCNGATGTEYAAIATEFEPTADTKIPTWLRDALFDEVFEQDGKDVANDLVVPTLGCYDENGAGGFPIDDRLEFPRTGGVHHSNFFYNTDVLKFLNERLSG